MARRTPTGKTRAKAPPATPVLEWTAATAGGLLTLLVLGYSIWEGVVDPGAPPDLSARVEAAAPTGNGFVLPVVVRNAAYATAADVEVRLQLDIAGQESEIRRVRLSYVPGQGEARGGVVFASDPARGRLSVRVEGFEAP